MVIFEWYCPNSSGTVAVLHFSAPAATPTPWPGLKSPHFTDGFSSERGQMRRKDDCARRGNSGSAVQPEKAWVEPDQVTSKKRMAREPLRTYRKCREVTKAAGNRNCGTSFGGACPRSEAAPGIEVV